MDEKFKGFTSKRQLVNFLVKLKEENDLELIEFSKGLFKAIKASNLMRYENKVKPNQEMLDAFSRLLVGDEVCSAIAISGEKLLLATNKHFHADDYIKYKKTVILLEKHRLKKWYKLNFKDTITYHESNTDKNPKVISKESGEVFYQLKNGKNKIFEAKRGNPRITFTQEEHNISFPNNPNAPISIKTSLNQEENVFNKVFSNLPINAEIEILPEIPVDINPLKRRATKLFRILALTSNSILKKPELKQEALGYLESLNEWPQFLHDSLTYEIAKSYKGSINSSTFDDPGMKAMLEFYESLIKDYVKFKQESNLTTSVSSIQAWFKNLKLDHLPETPEFIKKNPEPFLNKAQVYFSDLAKLQEHIRFDAENKGCLSQIISKSSLFERGQIVVEVIDGVEDVHAEMRLLEKHLTTHKNTEDYYGITMLCCALCTHTVENLHVYGERVTHTRGSHGTLYPKWKLIDPMKEESYLKQFLGDELYVMYQNLLNKKVYPPGVKNIPINLHNKSDIALLLIPSMG